MPNPSSPERTTGLIVGPDGAPLQVPTLLLSPEDARLLRLYKKFLLRYGLKEALYCDSCWDHNLSHGTESHVTDNEIVIRCRCSLRFYQGPSY